MQLLMAIFALVFVAVDCGALPQVDQNNNQDNTANFQGNLTINGAIWQSFTAGKTGKLSEVDFEFSQGRAAPFSGQLQLFLGVGTNGLLLETIYLGRANSINTDTNIGGFLYPGWNKWYLKAHVDAGSKYTFCFTGDTTSICVQGYNVYNNVVYGVAVTSDSYSAGTNNINQGYPYGTSFTTYVDTNQYGDPAPTASTTPTHKGVLDQYQLNYNSSLSALGTLGNAEAQTITAGLNGTMTEINLGFFGQIKGDGTLKVFYGSGVNGTLMFSTNVTVNSFITNNAYNPSDNFCWNVWNINVPVVKGYKYTFEFIPNPSSMPSPYGLCEGYSSYYSGGSQIIVFPTGQTTDPQFCLLFKTYVDTNNISPNPLPTPLPTQSLNNQVIDQYQTNFSVSSSVYGTNATWQSFTPGISGILSEIDMGFAYYQKMSLTGTLTIYSGAGNYNTILQSINVSESSVALVSTTNPCSWNKYNVNVPVLAGSTYTFSFVPNANSLPSTYNYGVCGGVAGSFNGTSSLGSNPLVFRTFVKPFNLISPTVTFTQPTTPVTYAAGKTFSLSTTSSSGGAVTYTSSNTNVISISASTATVKGVGTATITATVAATGNYASATATRSVTIK